jgi:hypothetical protein
LYIGLASQLVRRSAFATMDFMLPISDTTGLGSGSGGPLPFFGGGAFLAGAFLALGSSGGSGRGGTGCRKGCGGSGVRSGRSPSNIAAAMLSACATGSACVPTSALLAGRGVCAAVPGRDAPAVVGRRPAGGMSGTTVAGRGLSASQLSMLKPCEPVKAPGA